MERRLFIAVCGCAVSAVAGCGTQYDTGPVVSPESTSVESLHAEADVLFADDRSRFGFPGMGEHDELVVADRRTAQNRLRRIPAVREFVDNTTFEESYLVVVRNGMQSEMELVVQRVERSGDNLRIVVTVESPSDGPDDQTTHSLLVRITDTRTSVPEQTNVTISGYV